MKLLGGHTSTGAVSKVRTLALARLDVQRLHPALVDPAGAVAAGGNDLFEAVVGEPDFVEKADLEEQGHFIAQDR